MEEEGFIFYEDIYNNNHIRIESVLKNKANPNITTSSISIPPLCIAIRYNETRIVSLLLEYKANVNLFDDKGNTALHYAAWWSCGHIIPLLLAHGSNIETMNVCGNTPLSDAIFNRDDLSVHHLLDAGAKLITCKNVVPYWLEILLGNRSKVKRAIVTFFALNKRTKRIHKDLTNVIGAMIWETRRDEVWSSPTGGPLQKINF